MSIYAEKPEDTLFAEKNFEIHTLEDEIRVSDLCDRLLKLYYLYQVEDKGLAPEQASALAYGASYFLKDFIVDHCRENILTPARGRVRQFAGNWYIVKNLEPNMVELQTILDGVKSFYQYAAMVKMLSSERLAPIEAECADLSFYKERIESFWAIEKDGYSHWETACSLKD